MKNKSFWKGFAVAVVLALVIPTLCKGAVVGGYLSGGMLPFGMNLTADTKQTLIENLLEKYYVDGADKDAIEEGLYSGMTAGVGDVYTRYMPASSLVEYQDDLAGHFAGIGIYLYQDLNDSLVVSGVIPGQAAERAGLLPDDIFVSVDGQDVTGMTSTELVRLVKGEIGEDVTIVVYRPSANKNISYTITREDVTVFSVAGEMIDETTGYMQISEFKKNTYEQFMDVFKTLQDEGMERMVLDLRGNPGGLVNIVCQIGDELLPKGTMVYTEDKNGNRKDAVCDDSYSDIPLVLLVNGGSASSSEILAGAMKDTERAKLVGTQTYGKGIVQRLFYLPDGSGLSITVEKYYTPNGISIHGVGIAPDYEVELPEYNEETPEAFTDTQLEKALSLLGTNMDMGK